MYFDSKNWLVREEGDFRLIVPSFSLSNDIWNPENTWYRSRIEHVLTGATVSQGFGKFFNLGCGPLGLQITLQDVVSACERNDAIATLKIDGSLLIRSVYNGKVFFRTRGSFSADSLENGWEIDSIFRQKYPRLFDPHFAPNVSLLFEWVSPNNCIVIRYDEPALILVGAVCHSLMRYYTLSSLQSVAESAKVELVKNFVLTTKGWNDLYTTLHDHQDIEGYVIRIRNEQVLVKVKCESYITKHALKSNLNTDDLADLYFQLGQPSFQDFIKKFEAIYDEEIAMWAMPAISALYDGVKNFRSILRHMTKSVQKRKDMSRKDFAIEMQHAYGKTKRFAAIMQMYGGKEPDIHLLKSILLQNTKQVEMGIWTHEEDDQQ